MTTIASQKAYRPQMPSSHSRMRIVATSSIHPEDETPKRLQWAPEGNDQANEHVEQKIAFGSFQLFPTQRLLLEDNKPVPIGSRALDLLIALVKRSGQLVNKSELIAKVWPHAFVEEGNLKVQVAALRRALADGQAGNRYISTVAGRGYCFVAPVSMSGEPPSSAAQASTPKPLTNIPQPLMQLIGIDDLIRTISKQLADHRLVTLVGPGGIGKTSAAMAATARLAQSFEHGVWSVDFGNITDPTLLPAAIRSAVRLDNAEQHASSDLLSFLSDKRMLLVLDNCEQVIEAAAALVAQIGRASPHLHILATSREPLSIEHERLHHLTPLACPPASSALSAAEALKFPAIQLFVERAANVVGEFTLRDTDASTVVEICRRLDGIPLAIELAAGSIDALGLRGIALRLDDPLRLPVTRLRTAASRHRSLRAALDWSYRLLTEDEQRALRQLSVFGGSFTLEDATAVITDPTYTETTKVDLFVSLIAKSLVATENPGSDMRLRLLAMTRAYGLERLAESGEASALITRSRTALPGPSKATDHDVSIELD